MEDIYCLKGLPSVTEEPVNLREYFTQYTHILAQSSLPQHTGSNEALRKCFPPPPPEAKDDPFALEKLEAACSTDLLTVPDELPPQEVTDKLPSNQSGRVHSWFAGLFHDEVIPKEGKETLQTLASLSEEHKRRADIADYASLRHRHLKYFKTVRMMKNTCRSAEPHTSSSEQPPPPPLPPLLNDFVVNVRVYRPYHKKLQRGNAFPRHSQELLLLGSQPLTDLCDNIVCINNLAVGQDLSALPRYSCIKNIPSAAAEFPSSFIYINGIFYSDMRGPKAKDYSEVIKQWAKGRDRIGPMDTKRMEETYVSDLKLRLGYPYVYMHLGNCEHLLVFTDARLVDRDDVQDPTKYPVAWGRPSKLAARCQLCHLNLANWLVKGDSRLPLEYSTLCHRCLEGFCYDKFGKKEHTLRVYPFMDEFVQQQDMFKQF